MVTLHINILYLVCRWSITTWSNVHFSKLMRRWEALSQSTWLGFDTLFHTLMFFCFQIFQSMTLINSCSSFQTLCIMENRLWQSIVDIEHLVNFGLQFLSFPNVLIELYDILCILHVIYSFSRKVPHQQKSIWHVYLQYLGMHILHSRVFKNEPIQYKNRKPNQFKPKPQKTAFDSNVFKFIFLLNCMIWFGLQFWFYQPNQTAL